METCDELKRKRKLSKNWLTDDRFKTWIRKVPSDDSLFHCTICNKNLSCSSSHVSRHAESVCHKNNIKKRALSNSDEISPTRKSSRKATFQEQWLDIEKFKPWLREVPHDANSFSCLICDKTLTGGISQIDRHSKSKMHTDKSAEYDKEMETSTSNEQLAVIDEEVLLFEERKRSAEIRYAALIADKNIPHDAAKTILKFFQDSDPKVLKCMRMGRTKCTNIISNVLCPVETDSVVKNIQKTKFSIFINGSDILNEKWMTFFVRYINPETLNIHSQLVKLIDINETDYSTDKLFSVFKMEMWKLQIPFSNIVALSCDNISVLNEKHLVFKEKLEEMCENLLTLSCPCYSAALIADAACSKIPQICEEFIIKIVTYINSNPKYSIIFREFLDCFQKTDNKISDMRLLSRYSCVEKLLESWDTIHDFLNEILITKKSKPAKDLFSKMENVNIKTYLLFLKYILKFFNTFSTFFQVVETRIYLLHPKSIDFLTKVTKNFLKPRLSRNIANISNIKFSHNENQKSLNDVYLGPECEEYLNELMNKGEEYMDAVTNIRQNCLQFYITAAEEICKRLPITDQFFCKLKVFRSDVALFNIDRETSFSDLSFIAQIIGGFDENSLKKEWFTLYSDFTETEKQNLSKRNFDDMWKQILQCETNVIKYPNLRALLSVIRALPNSNTDTMFSFLSDIKAKKRSKLSSTSINAICALQSALKTRGENTLNMKIDAKHVSLMSSDKLYTNVPNKQKSSLTLYVADDCDDDDDDILVVGPTSSNDMR